MEVNQIKIVFDQELKDKWIKALKSGKYVQGTGELKVEDFDGVVKYCCLGVLGEICGIDLNDKNGRTKPYEILDEDVTNELWKTNDNLNTFDGKYSNVLPVIEGLEVSCG